MSCLRPTSIVRSVLAPAALLLLLSACSDEPAAPERLLLGTWGSPDAEVIAIDAGAEVRFGSAIVIHDPIALSAENTFAARGRLRSSTAVGGELPEASVTGSLSESRLTISVPDPTGDRERPTYVLEQGVSRAPMDVPECPL